MGRVATPLSIAASAVAGASLIIKRGSNGFGIKYSFPNLSSSPPYAATTASGVSSLAKSASA